MPQLDRLDRGAETLYLFMDLLKKGLSPLFFEDVSRVLEIREFFFYRLERRKDVFEPGLFLLEFLQCSRRRPGGFEGEIVVQLRYLFLQALYIKDNLARNRSLT